MENLSSKSNSQHFWRAFHPRLSEAVFHIREEPPEHQYRTIAELEIGEIQEEALASGLSEDEFIALCDTAYENQWHGEEGETFIETQEGRIMYNGTPAVITGQGQLPKGEVQSLRFLVKSSNAL